MRKRNDDYLFIDIPFISSLHKQRREIFDGTNGYDRRPEFFASASSFLPSFPPSLPSSLPPRSVITTLHEDTRRTKLWPTAARFFLFLFCSSFRSFGFQGENYRVPRRYLHVRYRHITWCQKRAYTCIFSRTKWRGTNDKHDCWQL